MLEYTSLIISSSVQPEGHGFDSQIWSLHISIYLNFYIRTLALGSTQPLTEIVPGIFLGGKGRPKGKADNLNAVYQPIV
jgi:hypothetical protein